MDSPVGMDACLMLTILCQAAELLSHPHLQPHVLKIHLKLNSPRRNSFPVQWSESNFIKKTRFTEPEAVSIFPNREKRRSFSNDRTLNPSISETEDSPDSSQTAEQFPSYLTQQFKEISFSVVHEEIEINKEVATKFSMAAKTPRMTPSKVSATPKRQTIPSKMPQTGSKRDSVSLQKCCSAIGFLLLNNSSRFIIKVGQVACFWVLWFGIWGIGDSLSSSVVVLLQRPFLVLRLCNIAELN